MTVFENLGFGFGYCNNTLTRWCILWMHIITMYLRLLHWSVWPWVRASSTVIHMSSLKVQTCPAPAVKQTLEQFETNALHEATGNLQRSQWEWIQAIQVEVYQSLLRTTAARHCIYTSHPDATFLSHSSLFPSCPVRAMPTTVSVLNITFSFSLV